MVGASLDLAKLVAFLRQHRTEQFLAAGEVERAERDDERLASRGVDGGLGQLAVVGDGAPAYGHAEAFLGGRLHFVLDPRPRRVEQERLVIRPLRLSSGELGASATGFIMPPWMIS